MRHRCPPQLNVLACGLALLLAQVATASGAEKASPAGKFFVAEVKGDATVSTEGKIVPLAKKATFVAEGAVINTKEGASVSLVFSNGMAVTAGANSRFEVRKFQQESFEPNRNDLDVEPSATQTSIRLVQGGVGLCTSRMVAGSNMTYTTPHGSVTVRGHKVVIDVRETETRVLLVEGDVTLVGDTPEVSRILSTGQQAVLRKGAADQVASIVDGALSAEATAQADEQVTLACMARRTVYFESVQPADGETPDLVPVETVPAAPPTQFTISPDRLAR